MYVKGTGQSWKVIIMPRSSDESLKGEWLSFYGNVHIEVDLGNFHPQNHLLHQTPPSPNRQSTSLILWAALHACRMVSSALYGSLSQPVELQIHLYIFFILL